MVAAMTEALSVSIENYLETIFLLVKEHTVARSKDISEFLKVNRSSGRECCKRCGIADWSTTNVTVS